MTSLKEELLGAWKLLSYIEVPIGGDDSLFPMGKSPHGLLIYSTDGYMSVQISKQERPLVFNNESLRATLEDIKTSIVDYIAFCTKITIDYKNAIISYLVKNSLFPSWINKKESRKVDFDGNILYLKSTEPVLSNGVYVNTYMTWERMKVGAADDTSVKLLDIAKPS